MDMVYTRDRTHAGFTRELRNCDVIFGQRHFGIQMIQLVQRFYNGLMPIILSFSNAVSAIESCALGYLRVEAGKLCVSGNCCTWSPKPRHFGSVGATALHLGGWRYEIRY